MRPLVKLSFLFAVLLCGLQNRTYGQARYSVATGNWNSTATWSATSGGVSGASVPTSANDVIIERGFTVTLNTNGQCASLTFNPKTGGGAALSQLSIGAFTLTVSGNTTLNGSAVAATRATKILYTSATGILTIGGNLQLGSGSAIGNSAIIDMSNGVNLASTLNVADNMTRNTTDGQFIPGTGSTVNYNGSVAQTVNVTQFTYANLTTNNTEAITGATLGAAVTATNVTGNISVNSGLFMTNNLAMAMANSKNLTVALSATMDAGTTSILMGTTASVTINGTFITANTNGFSGTAATAIRSTNTPTITLGGSSTIEYNAAAAQTATNRTDYANLTLTGGSKTIGTAAAQTVTLSKNLTINTGATYLGSTWNPILNIGGDFSNSGTFTQGSSLVTFNGTAAQTVLGSSSTTFSNNVTLNNAAGLSITTSPTINGTLTFTNGKITTGANKLILGSAATTAGAAAGRYVYGNLEIFIPNAAGPSRTFIIGDASNYTPVLVAFTGTTTGSGSLIAYTTSGDDADIDNSGINSTLSVNRTWTVTQGTIPVGGFTSYSGTFTFIGGSPVDLDAGANTANFVVRKYDAGSWAITTTGTRTATTTQATGMTAFGQFQVGEARTITVATNPSNSTICAGSNTTFTSTSTSIPAPSVKWQRGNPGYTDITAGLDAPNTTYSDFTTSTLTLTGSETPINGYLYRAVFTNINGSATSTAATLTVNASPTITTQPSNQTVCISVNANFNVVTSAGSPAYQWQMSSDDASWVNVANGTPAGVTYTNPTTATLTANGTSALSLYYYRCVVMAGGCSRNSNSATLTINTVPAASGAITGTSSVCQSQTGVAYSVAVISGATSYSWTYSGTGFIIATGAGTNSITADFSASATSGNLTVRGTNGCGNGTVSPDYTITVSSSVPAAAGAITGYASTCQTQTYPYSVSPISGATSYTWNYSGTGLTFSGPTASMDGSYSGSATSGNLSVSGTNGCGSGNASPNFVITVSTCQPHTTPLTNCNGCHMLHGDPVGGPINASPGNSNLCISCHNPAGVASQKPFNNSNKAVPGVSGNSHTWDELAVNALRETVTPDDAQTIQKDSMRLRLPGGKIICSTCHDQHYPVDDPPFLRVSNGGNAMCKDCHSPRDRGLYSSDPVNNRGTHPVGVAYPVADSRFNAAPTDSVLVVGGNVECTSCHKIHYAPFNDGYILRAANNNESSFCQKCHTYGQHNNMGCTRCHQPHNTDKANIYMIRNTISTPPSDGGGQLRAVVFTAETGPNSFADGDATYNGICEVCHTATPGNKHQNSAGGDHAHNAGANCTTCHTHKSNFAGCTNCHNTNFPEYSTDAHQKHATQYGFPCSTCHYQRGAGTAFHENAVKDVNFDPAGLAYKYSGVVNGYPAVTPAWNSGTKTCTDIYCHSNAMKADRGTDGTYSWAGSVPFSTGTQVYATTPNWTTGTITDCNSCHQAGANPVVGNMTNPYTITAAGPATGHPPTGQHQRGAHLSNDYLTGLGWRTDAGVSVQCFWCHNADPNPITPTDWKYQGTYGTAYHVDGQTYFKPQRSDYAPDPGTMAPGLLRGNADGHCSAAQSCWDN
ncbi:MAG: CxxxxCH/CxxCH domain-containing protein [Bacteroidetes bacterium]|nr:CxxxxCH/CxxCH domain-containing protein [Bacteroidota bacterium]